MSLYGYVLRRADVIRDGGDESPGAGVTDWHELTAWCNCVFLWKSRQLILTTEPFPRLHFPTFYSLRVLFLIPAFVLKLPRGGRAHTGVMPALATVEEGFT